MPTVRASETLEMEPENSSDRASLENCFKLLGMSSEFDRRKRLRSEKRRLTVSAEEETASSTEASVFRRAASFLRVDEIEGWW